MTNRLVHLNQLETLYLFIGSKGILGSFGVKRVKSWFSATHRFFFVYIPCLTPSVTFCSRRESRSKFQVKLFKNGVSLGSTSLSWEWNINVTTYFSPKITSQNQNHYLYKLERNIQKYVEKVTAEDVSVDRIQIFAWQQERIV